MAVRYQRGAAEGLQLAWRTVGLLCAHELAKHPRMGKAKVINRRYAALDKLSIQVGILHSSVAKATCSGEGLVYHFRILPCP